MVGIMKQGFLPWLKFGLVWAGVFFLGFLTWCFFVRGIPQPRNHWVECLRNEDVDARLQAVQELGRISADEKTPDRDLIAALKDENADVRLIAAEWLGNLGLQYKDPEPGCPEGMRAVPALIATLQDKHAGVRKEAARSILRIIGYRYSWKHTRRKALVEALVKALRDDKQDVRQKAAQVLKQVDPQRAATAGVP
jgi:HEAT repeat protein